MPRVGSLLLVLVVAAGAAVGAVPRPPAAAFARAATEFVPADDPFPIRRVRGPDAGLNALVKELEPGPTVRLPRAEFEARVRAAGRARAGQPARVIEAAYSATLEAGDLTGTAALVVLNAQDATGFVPLDPLRLAVRGAKWADGPDAVLAARGGAPAVWVDRDGRRTLHLNWSLAGTTEPGERRFELRVPPCPASALELNLPADQVPSSSSDVLLTGPFDAPGAPGRRAWRLRFGGRKVEFAVRAAGAPAGIARAKLVAKYDLAPGQLTATFEYDLRPARGTAGEWTFTAAPGLRVLDVATNNRAAWAVEPAAAPNGPARVRVSLRQPGPGGKVTVTAVAPFPDPARPDAPLPAVRPLSAVLDEEELELRVAPALKVDGWAPGDYRLLDASASVLSVADQARTFALTGTLLAPGADEPFRRTPTVRTVPAEAEFAALERLEWELDPARSALVARIGVRVRRGPLFQVTVRPPVGYTLDRAATGSDDLVSHIGAATAAGHVVEFTRPLAAGQRAELRLAFRGPGARPGEPVPFPALAVAGATERDGWLSATAGPEWEMATRPGAGATPGGLWGWFTTDAPANGRALYLYRGREPDGTATLTPTRATVTADARTVVDAGARWATTTRFALTVARGAAPAVVAFVPGPHEPRSWKLLDETNAVVAAVPLPVGPLGGPRGTVWLVRFARPLVGPAVLESAAPGPPSAERFSFAAPHLLGAPPGRVELAPALKDRAALQPALNDRWTAALSGRGDARPDAVSDAYLVTAVRGPGDVLAAFGGTATGGSTVGVFLPEGAEVRGACVGGRWLNPAACAARDARGALPVPIPTGAGGGVRFEVRYRVPVESGWPTRRLNNRVTNTTAGSVFPIKEWWVFAPGVLPASFGEWAVTDEKLPLLGGPLVSEVGALVVRPPAGTASVRTGATRTADALAVGTSAVVLMIGLVVARRRRAAGVIVLGVVALVTFTLAELGAPWWARVAWPPFCTAVGALVLVFVRVAVHARPGRAVAAAAGVLFALTATAQPPAPVTVLLVTDAEGREEVVAARATMERLDTLAKPQPPAAVVTAAEYDVRADDAGARVTAKFVVHAFRAGDNAVSLPLDGARLERATVDGAPAFPAAPRPDLYTVAVGGPGRHEVEVRFAATVTATGPDRELRFGAPEVPAARLTASLPGAARQPTLVGRVGRQTVATGDRTTVEADLGGARLVSLRWREGAGGAAVVRVRECGLWDVSESGADLTAAYLVRVEQGAAAGLRFEVPAELEVVRVAARTGDAPAAPVALRDWALGEAKGAFRPLRLDFQAPVAGRFVVVLECAPRKPLARHPVLRFPRVAFGTVTGEVESVYGLRTARVTLESVGSAGLIDFPPEALKDKDFVAVPDLKIDPNATVVAYRPAPGAAGELRPVLRATEQPLARTVTAWQVGPHRADAAGVVSWVAKEPLPFVEFTVPGVRVLDVRGPDVVAWSQGTGRVQVWIRAGTKEGAVEWTGTAALAPPAKPTDPVAFDPTWPRVHGTKIAGDEVRVRPASGWTAAPDRVRGWEAVPDRTGDLRFRTDAPSPQSLRVLLAPAPPAR